MADSRVGIAVEVLEQMLAKGHCSRPYEVTEGPEPDARVLGSYFDPLTRQVVLVYDRPVEEPQLVTRD